MIRAFFRSATRTYRLAENPIPLGKDDSAFKFKVEKPEVIPPTPEEIERVLTQAPGVTKLLAHLMRWSAMSISDAVWLRRDKLVSNVITGRRRKTNEPYRVMIPAWLADGLRTLPHEVYFFHDEKSALPEQNYAHRLRAVFAAAGVRMSSHRFRHFRISEWLSRGRSTQDVADMVGTSAAEILKTYRHFVKESTDRLDRLQVMEFETHSPVAPRLN